MRSLRALVDTGVTRESFLGIVPRLARWATDDASPAVREWAEALR